MQLLKRFPSVPSVNPDLLGGCDFKSPLHRCGIWRPGSQRVSQDSVWVAFGSNPNIRLLTCEVEIPAPAAENVNVTETTQKVLWKMAPAPHVCLHPEPSWPQQLQGLPGHFSPLPTDTHLGISKVFSTLDHSVGIPALPSGWQENGFHQLPHL